MTDKTVHYSTFKDEYNNEFVITFGADLKCVQLEGKGFFTEAQIEEIYDAMIIANRVTHQEAEHHEGRLDLFGEGNE